MQTDKIRSIKSIDHFSTNHRVDFFGIPVVDLTMDDLVAQVESHLVARESTHLVNLNPYHFLIAGQDADFASICRSGDIVFTDGVGILLASRVGQHPIRNRFTGLDLMTRLCEVSSVRGFSVFLLGGTGGMALRCARYLENRFPRLTVAGVYEPPLADSIGEFPNDEIVRSINDASPDILFVAFGAPKQEKWIERFRDRLNVPIMMGVGGSFDILGGRFSRAPRWIRSLGLEWLFRLGTEPRRLAPRYLIGIPRFVAQILRLRFGQSHTHPAA